MINEKKNIGFISTRFAGTDGVSLETEKWVKILEELGHSCYFFAGESDYPEDRTYIVPKAHFNHPEIKEINVDCFDDYKRSSKTSGMVQAIRYYLKNCLYTFLKKFNIDLLIVENALSLPMNLPLGLALTEIIAETDMPTIAHHHDFSWERERYAVTAAHDYLRSSFPPTLHSITHVVINSYAGRELGLRTGVSSILVPNVMDFDTPPPAPSDHANNLKQLLGIKDDEHFLLQPTRIVPRKRIQFAIELVRRLRYNHKKLRSVLVITHASGDEGDAYAQYLREYAKLVGVRLIHAAHLVEANQTENSDPDKLFTLADFYQQADLITYPSTVEGFGNAFLEAIYYKKPIFMSGYEIFKTDIKPKGFKVIDFNEFINEESIEKVSQVLINKDLVTEMVEYNYELGKKYYSFQTLKRRLLTLLELCYSY